MRVTRSGFFRRLHARLHDDERGFTLIETVIAITVVFASLTALAYAATAGFGYQALTRERQAANGIADKIMENVRGLAYSKVQKGLAASELAGDPNLVTGCSGDPAGTYRFKSCTAGTTPGSGEIVVANGQPNTPPLVPHTGTLSAGYPTAFTYSVYVTNNDITKNPYRVTVIVNWSGGRINGAAKSITTQSLFWSPSGCVSNQTHPYAAPCQPFFYGQAQIPRGDVGISGTIEGLSFSQANLSTSGAESDGQQEQFSSAQGAYTQSGATLVDGAGAQQSVGGTAATTAASDTDPGGTVPTYGYSTMASGSGGSASVSSGQTSFSVTAPSGDTATAEAATTANASQACPPWSPQTDALICAGTQIQQGSTGNLSATAAFDGIQPGIGSASLVTIGSAASNPDKTLVDRIAVSGQDGQLASTVTRRFGTINLVALPSGFTLAGGGGYPAAWAGYLVTLTGYADTATATVGTGATTPTGSVTAGTISYWNGAGYSSVSATQSITPAPVTITQTIDGHSVEIDITSTSLSGATFTPTSTALSGSPAALGDADGTMTGPLTGTITYILKVDDVTVVRLSIQIDLGTMTARGTYQRAPTPG